MSSEYCKYLKKLGKLDFCDPLKPGLILRETRLAHHYKAVVSPSFSNCIDLCEEEINCLASTFCTKCKKNNHLYTTCFMYSKLTINKPTAGESTKDKKVRWDSAIFTYKIPFPDLFQFSITTVIGISRLSPEESRLVKTAEQCFDSALTILTALHLLFPNLLLK
ncbi:unnamed protein product [Mytilus edulis]|uniref:Uncharacterized protein n=1 Tax=Mytilus edulis TaxID=6550 RepID=A0A8S3S068_MYTED|nr:unnamed protein product [Mytilus edulis]